MLSNSPSKLGKDIWSFNLPLESCRHKTEYCRQYCYAKKGRWHFPKVREILKQNLIQSDKDSFVELVNDEVARLKVLKNLRFIRIHSSGDFYNQKYFNKWIKIAISNPDVRFVAYTRNWEIKCDKRPENFTLYYSVDRSTQRLNTTIPTISYFTEKTEMPKAKVCHGKCSECGYCYLVGKDVSMVHH